MLFTFLIEIILALALWFVLKRILRGLNSYVILVICLSLALVAGFVVAYRGTGFQITTNYLTEVNNQKIEITGKSLTLDEENSYKKELFQMEEFKKARLTSSIKTSLYPFAFVLLVMLFFARKTTRNLTLT